MTHNRTLTNKAFLKCFIWVSSKGNLHISWSENSSCCCSLWARTTLLFQTEWRNSSETWLFNFHTACSHNMDLILVSLYFFYWLSFYWFYWFMLLKKFIRPTVMKRDLSKLLIIQRCYKLSSFLRGLIGIYFTCLQHLSLSSLLWSDFSIEPVSQKKNVWRSSVRRPALERGFWNTFLNVTESMLPTLWWSYLGKYGEGNKQTSSYVFCLDDDLNG